MAVCRARQSSAAWRLLSRPLVYWCASMPTLLDNLRSGRPVIAAELRPPRAELEASASMDAWIDTYHAVRGLTRGGTHVFLTDGAVGLKEEDNLRHLVMNLGADVARSTIVPFLTCKHP